VKASLRLRSKGAVDSCKVVESAVGLFSVRPPGTK
jgi:hypothetical protein